MVIEISDYNQPNLNQQTLDSIEAWHVLKRMKNTGIYSISTHEQCLCNIQCLKKRHPIISWITHVKNEQTWIILLHKIPEKFT